MSKRKLICTIDINDIIHIEAANRIIQDIKNKAIDEPWMLPITLQSFKSSDSDIIRVKFTISPFELEKYCNFSVDDERLGHASVYATDSSDCVIIASIRRNPDADIVIANNIVRELKKCACTDELTFINTIKLMTAPGGYIQVKFLVPIVTLKDYHDFFIGIGGLGNVLVYATLKEKESEIIKDSVEKIKKEIARASGCESVACINTSKMEVSDINIDDFEYICDRCGVKVKTPNTLRGPANIVDFYREVEEDVGDSISYKLCQNCMRDFFSFLSYD